MKSKSYFVLVIYSHDDFNQKQVCSAASHLLCGFYSVANRVFFNHEERSVSKGETCGFHSIA